MKNVNLAKLLNTIVKKKFSDQIDEIRVFTEDLGGGIEYTHIFVLLNKYEDIDYAKEIRQYVDDISKYSGIKINQISFTDKETHY